MQEYKNYLLLSNGNIIHKKDKDFIMYSAINIMKSKNLSFKNIVNGLINKKVIYEKGGWNYDKIINNMNEYKKTNQ